jgi:hypothetical protein
LVQILAGSCQPFLFGHLAHGSCFDGIGHCVQMLAGPCLPLKIVFRFGHIALFSHADVLNTGQRWP